MAATPFSFSGTLNIPAAPGLPTDPIPLLASGTYLEEARFRFDLTGSGTQTVNLGSIGSPGVKALLVTVEASSTAAPIEIRINGVGAGEGIEVSPGGFAAVGSPSPVTGITAIVLAYTTAVVVRIWALG